MLEHLESIPDCLELVGGLCPLPATKEASSPSSAPPRVSPAGFLSLPFDDLSCCLSVVASKKQSANSNQALISPLNSPRLPTTSRFILFSHSCLLPVVTVVTVVLLSLLSSIDCLILVATFAPRFTQGVVEPGCGLPTVSRFFSAYVTIRIAFILASSRPTHPSSPLQRLVKPPPVLSKP